MMTAMMKSILVDVNFSYLSIEHEIQGTLVKYR